MSRLLTARVVALAAGLAAGLVFAWGCGADGTSEPPSTPTDVDTAVTTILGQVEPRVPGVGVIGVRNGVSSAIATTDSDGAYALRDIPAGEYNLIASGPGFFTDTSARRIVVARGEQVEAPLITMRPITAAATIRGQAVAADTGKAMPDVQVTVECRAGVCSNITAVTDEAGRFEVSIWPELDARIVFQAAGYAPLSITVAGLGSGVAFDAPAARLTKEGP
ncbi:hypothetical protein HN371_02075 [Candidatus Poribacteria bacterium]|jgi:hypothetical protein|nr:hypothetical protein [Candidatus Poribacteria bacterium]MBT5535613.1 hypothetical protein [Candidatus Poribacteria bacterium]MBT7805445.1 hypothetical protein [Candidatus Poribacteria bacterium]